MQGLGRGTGWVCEGGHAGWEMRTRRACRTAAWAYSARLSRVLTDGHGGKLYM